MSAQSGYHDGELLPCQRVNTTSIYMVHLPTDAVEHAGLASQFVACHKACCMQGTHTGDGDSFVTTQVEGVVRGHSQHQGWVGVGWRGYQGGWHYTHVCKLYSNLEHAMLYVTAHVS